MNQIKEHIPAYIGLGVYTVVGALIRYFMSLPCDWYAFHIVMGYYAVPYLVIGIGWGLYSFILPNTKKPRIGQGVVTGLGVGFGGMTIAILVLNPCTSNQTATNLINTDTSLVYGTWALVIVTLVGIVITTILTKKSLNETKRATDMHRLELEHRLRTDIRYAPQNSFMDKTNSKLQIRGVLNNEGQIEAYDFQVHVYSFKNNPSFEQILQSEKEIKKNSFPIEGSFPYQQRTYQFAYKVDWNFEGELFVVLWIHCKFFEDSEDEKIYVLRCYGEPCETTNIFTKNNIIRARKERPKGF